MQMPIGVEYYDKRKRQNQNGNIEMDARHWGMRKEASRRQQDKKSLGVC